MCVRNMKRTQKTIHGYVVTYIHMCERVDWMSEKALTE